MGVAIIAAIMWLAALTVHEFAFSLTRQIRRTPGAWYLVRSRQFRLYALRVAVITMIFVVVTLLAPVIGG